MLEKLTNEQEAEIQNYLEKWLKVGYRTETQDVEMAKEFVHFLYDKFLSLPVPEIYFVDSPLAGQKLINKLDNDGVEPDKGSLQYYEPARENWWMSYFSKYDCVLNVLFPEEKSQFELFQKFLDYSENCHMMWALDKAVVICDFPVSINASKEIGLDSKFGPSVLYKDGYATYALEGTSMDKEDWERETAKYKSTLAGEIFKKI